MPSFKHQNRPRKRRTFHPPPKFWDKLTELYLTKSALREDDRRHNLLLSPKKTSSSTSNPQTSASDFLRNCSTACLQEVRKLSRSGGPDLSDIRDYPVPAHFNHYSMSPSTNPNTRSKRPPSTPTHTTSSSPTTKVESTTVYDRHFKSHLIDHGVFLPSFIYPDDTSPSEPSNMAEIRARIRAPRPSLALSEEKLEKEYEQFVRIDNKAVDEQLVIKNILPILEGQGEQSQQDHHAHNDRIQDQAPASCGTNHAFKNLAPLTDGTLPDAKPSFYHGARADQLHPRIREQLSDTIIPTRRSNRPIAPNFFVEAKGHDRSFAVIRLQALYAGALDARGMHSLQQYGHGHGHGVEQPNNSTRHSDNRTRNDYNYDKQAYTITSTYHARTLGIYAIRPIRSESKDRATDYMMTQVGKWCLDGSPENYKQGLNAYRNSRDLAKEYRDEFIRQANDRYAAGRDHAVGSSDGSGEVR